MRDLVARLMAKLTSKLLTLMRNRVPQEFEREEYRYMRLSFSQFGEDLAVERWIETLKPDSKIYVDVGCFHPIHCSNTLWLNKRGWKGVNVDADADKIEKFVTARPSDYNVVAAVSSREEKCTFLRYEGTGTNRLASGGELNLHSAIGEPPLESVTVTTRTLDSILESSPWPITSIGYLNVDCEGHDLEVLKGLDFVRYKPAIITIEALTPEETRAITEFLVQQGYQHMETIYRTLVFVFP